MRFYISCYFAVILVVCLTAVTVISGNPLSTGAFNSLHDISSVMVLDVQYDAENALYYVGDTTNPACHTEIPMRLNIRPDTNYWYGNVLWADSGEWGNASSWDSIRITPPCADEGQWETEKDASVMMHYSCIEIPGGFPQGDPDARDIWCTGTPLSLVGNACEEDVHVFAAEDLWNVTNRISSKPADTIANPIILPSDIIIDTIYWYLLSSESGIDSFYTFYDTGRYVPESVLVPEYEGADAIQTWLTSVHTADPRLVMGQDGYLYIFFQAAFAACWYHGGHYNCMKAGAVYVARSLDGFHWHDLTRITHLNAGLACPAPLIDAEGMVHMWMVAVAGVEASYQVGRIYKFSSKDIMPDSGYWPPPVACTHDFVGGYGNCSSERIWHIGVKAVDTSNMLMTFNTSAAECDDYIGICASGDGGDSWSCQRTPILETSSNSWDNYQLYAPELMPWSGASSGWLVFYSGQNSFDEKWHSGFTPLLIGSSSDPVRGDVNGDNFVNIGDATYLVNFVFKSGPPPVEIWTGDANCDDNVDVGDIVFLINYIFKFGPAPGSGCPAD